MGRAAIQLAFTLFVVTETWLVPIEAWFVDKYGPKVVVMFGGVMIAIAWVMNSYADTLVLLYLGAIFGGIGAGSVYGTCVGNALKWFPDRRGLAAGATAAGFGAGAAITVVPIANMVAASGYQHAFLTFGIGQGVIVFVLALFLRKPSRAMPAKKKQLHLPQTKIDFTPPQVLRSPIFWVMYLVFVMVAAGGLMAAAQIAPIAHDFKIDNEPVGLFGFQMAALTFAISLDRIFDGFGSPVLRLGVRHHRPRAHHVHRVWNGRADAADALGLRPYPNGIRARHRGLFRRVRRNLQPVPGNSRRYVRIQIRHHQQRHVVHREGHGLAAGAGRKSCRQPLRLAGGVRDRGGAQRHRGADGRCS